MVSEEIQYQVNRISIKRKQWRNIAEEIIFENFSEKKNMSL